MSPNKSKLKDKSSGDGVSSYRITSYLTLSQTTINKRAEAKGEEAKEVMPDLFNDGVIVATDIDAPSSTKPKRDKKGKLIKKGLSPIEKVKLQFNNIKEMITNTISYPFRIIGFYLDIILENVALITQNMGAILSLAYRAMVKQIKDSKPFKGEDLYEPLEPELEEDDEDEEKNEENHDDGSGYNKYTEDGIKKISFLDLHELNINFTDNKNNALFHFDIRKTQSYRPSPMVIDPIATKASIGAIHECAERAASIPPAMEGPYANIPLSTVLSNIDEGDLQAFLRYVKVYPGNYVGRNLKISETFATWIVYGAPSP
ncbi:MAG: hypothetical protein H7263_00945 [Candidatus Sericytochromatia bacterium]|nr:hypothetical protein [Candidatus Sericytochromatia bacterium]